MKLESLYIGHHRVLHNLTLDFQRTPDPLASSQRYALDFLVGVNGTGKSTTLQLVGMIFARLHQESASVYRFPVPIDLKYSLRRNDLTLYIRICNIAARIYETAAEPQAEGEGERLPTLHYKKGTGEDWEHGDWQDGALAPLTADELPHVVIYSTGHLTDWRQVLKRQVADSQTSVQDEQETPATAIPFEWPGHRVEPKVEETQVAQGRTRVTFIEPDRLALITLCGLIADRWNTEERRLIYVLKEGQVKALRGFSLRLRYHAGLHDLNVKRVIDQLTAIATRTIQQGSDQLLIFDLPQDEGDAKQESQRISLESTFGKLYNTPLQMFEELYALYEHAPEADCPLREVNLFIERPSGSRVDNEKVPMLHLFRWLSDGEQSLLARMALLSLFRDHNLLILLDEPEVHFNDVWKREIINVLDKIMNGYNSHTLIATHSSIALTDVPKDDIIVLHREGRYTSRATPPAIQTFGADPSDILVHVFGTPSASGERSVSYIQRTISTSRTKEDFAQLESIVAPGYWRYRIQLEQQRLRVVGVQ